MATSFYTSVDLLSSVPLDPEYRNTLTFDSVTAQTTYFSGKISFTTNQFTNLSYQRYQRGSIKLQAPINKLGSVNYLRFRNANATGEDNLHENKWFYAFITSMEYISDTVVKIDYQIDVIQTWLKNFAVNPCFVMREHTNDDSLGANLVEEGLDTGDLICQDMETLDRWISSTVDSVGNISLYGFYLVIATQAPDGSQGWHIMGGSPHALYFGLAGDVNELGDILNSYVSGATQNLDPIIAIYQIPDGWYVSQSQSIMQGQFGSFITRRCTLAKDMSVGVGPFVCYNSELGTLKSYSAKNKKLLTSPYNYMILESPDGKTVKLKFENFKDLSVHQKFDGVMSVFPFVETAFTPVDYECQSGITSSNGQVSVILNPEYVVSSKQYPTCGVASDAFMAWWAQNKYSMPAALAGDDAMSNMGNKQFYSGNVTPELDSFGNKLINFGIAVGKNLTGHTGSGGGSTQLQVLSDALRLGSSFLGGNPLNAAASIADDVGKQLASYKGHQALPSTMATKAENGGIFHAINDDCYKIYYMRVKPEYAEIIDNYFSCFGYATNKVKRPNTDGRQNWNYVQTRGCTISGNIPVEAEREICKIFDRGITFWHNPNTFLQYNQPNPIVT